MEMGHISIPKQPFSCSFETDFIFCQSKNINPYEKIKLLLFVFRSAILHGERVHEGTNDYFDAYG